MCARSICWRISVRMLMPLTSINHEMFQCVTVCDDNISRIVSVCNIRRGGGYVAKMSHLTGRQGARGSRCICTLHPKIFSEKFPTCQSLWESRWGAIPSVGSRDTCQRVLASVRPLQSLWEGSVVSGGRCTLKGTYLKSILYKYTVRIL